MSLPFNTAVDIAGPRWIPEAGARANINFHSFNQWAKAGGACDNQSTAQPTATAGSKVNGSVHETLGASCELLA
eukprot:5018458-Alexandrium_andersonii.AAC.1